MNIQKRRYQLTGKLIGLESLGHMTWKLMEFLSHKYRNKCFQMIFFFSWYTHIYCLRSSCALRTFNFYSPWRQLYFQKLNVIRTEERSLRGQNDHEPIESGHSGRCATSEPTAARDCQPQTEAPAADWWGHLHIHQSELCQVRFMGFWFKSVREREKKKKDVPSRRRTEPGFNFCP